jgi:hypothetical protein
MKASVFGEEQVRKREPFPKAGINAGLDREREL